MTGTARQLPLPAGWTGVTDTRLTDDELKRSGGRELQMVGVDAEYRGPHGVVTVRRLGAGGPEEIRAALVEALGALGRSGDG